MVISRRQSPEKSKPDLHSCCALVLSALHADRFFRINVTFIDKDGTKVDLQVAEGDNLLDIAQANDLEMEGELSRDDACLSTSI